MAIQSEVPVGEEAHKDTPSGLSTAPNYGIRVEPAKKRVVVAFGGEIVADSERALLLHETRHAPVYYFPRADVRLDLLESSNHHTYCPFKGDASYWSVVVGGRRADNAVWSYEHPYAGTGAEPIAGYVAFYPERMDAWYEDGERVGSARVQERLFPANPLADWLLREAWEAPTSRELTARFGRVLNEAGIDVYRVNVVIQTLHPLISATSYRWMRDDDTVHRFDADHEIRTKDRHLKSPLAPIFNGLGGVRRWIGPDTGDADEFPIIADLRAEGATDYVAMPMRFSSGQVNAVTLVTRAPGGFTTEQLGWIHEILPALSRFYEVHANRRSATTLLQTFLGPSTGRRVLDGAIRRGDGEDIHAVIWFCDLRNSTAIADSMPREAFLDYLNRYFDCMGGAVIANGGEVLRFVGDAVLAIFPIADSDCDGRPGECPASEACKRAVAAAHEAVARVAAANEACAREGLPPLEFGIGLHVGRVTYGNIGTPERLEFTVIGAAANEAARIEAMTKEVGHPVVVSAAFAEHYGHPLAPLGRHALRGVNHEVELFALPLALSGVEECAAREAEAPLA